MTDGPVIIFGPGYTGSRVAISLRERGVEVYCAARDAGKYAELSARGIPVRDFGSTDLPAGVRVVYTIPPAGQEVPQSLAALRPSRVVYVSSTAVYGATTAVDHTAEAKPDSAVGEARYRDELWFGAQDWSLLILRAAGIYGPFRGVHARIRAGEELRQGGNAVTSRIHVGDLVRAILAGLEGDLTGAWPVADESPCPSEEVAEWCRVRWGRAIAPRATFSSGGRAVDARETFRRLGIQPLWKNWKAGIEAALAEEAGQTAAG